MNKKTFKDFVAKDLDVFLNCEEMASEHFLDGESLTLVVVDSNFEELKGFGKDHLSAAQEVFQVYKKIYVKEADYFIPKVGSRVDLDGCLYYVEESGEEMGVVRIVIGANES